LHIDDGLIFFGRIKSYSCNAYSNALNDAKRYNENKRSVTIAKIHKKRNIS
jgi:hypothetical protein